MASFTKAETKVKGGDKLQKYLLTTARQIGQGGTVRVGFLEGARYPTQDRAARLRKGVAKLNAVGPKRRVSIGPRKQTLAPSLPVATVAFWQNFGTSRARARPFFSDMIAEDSPTWGRKLGKIYKASEYNSKLTLGRMGEYIQGRLVKKIVDWPADNAPLTVAIKGFNKGLIDTAVMQNHTGFEVKV